MTKRLSEETETRLTGPSISGKTGRNILPKLNDRKTNVEYGYKIHNDHKKMTVQGATSHCPFAAVKDYVQLYCSSLTSFQEHICEVKRPEPQEAVFRAGATERWGHADTIDGNACIWSTQPQTHISMLFLTFSNHCSALNLKTGSLFHPDFDCTSLQRRFLPAIFTQLLRRLQPPDVFDYNSTVVNFKDVTIPTACISVGKQSRRSRMTATISR